MFKNFVYKVWLVIGLIVLLIVGFVVNELQKGEQLNSENKAELNAYGVKTEALTYDYGWRGNRKKFSSKSKKRVVFYCEAVECKIVNKLAIFYIQPLRG